MTFDELVQAFDKAYCEKLDDAEGTRAGVRAVVLALRDESYACDYGDEWLKMLNEILGDAGAEKVAGGATRKDVLDGGAARTVTQVPGSPATDTAPTAGQRLIKAAHEAAAIARGKVADHAPAVCVWTPYTDENLGANWWRSCGGVRHRYSFDGHHPCTICGKPIRFAEAK